MTCKKQDDQIDLWRIFSLVCCRFWPEFEKLSDDLGKAGRRLSGAVREVDRISCLLSRPGRRISKSCRISKSSSGPSPLTLSALLNSTAVIVSTTFSFSCILFFSCSLLLIDCNLSHPFPSPSRLTSPGRSSCSLLLTGKPSFSWLILLSSPSLLKVND